MGSRFSRCFNLQGYIHVTETKEDIFEDFYGNNSFEEVDLDIDTVIYKNPKGKKQIDTEV